MRWRRVVGGLIAGGLLLAGCSVVPTDSGPVPPGAIAPSPSRAPSALPGAGTSEVRVDRDRGPVGYLTGVRLARQDGFDRLVLEFTDTDRVPGYVIGYQPLPVRADGSGDVVPTPGATRSVVLSVRPATGYRMETATPTYPGPRTVTADTAAVTQVVAAGDFEAVLTWAVGLRAETPFRVTELTAPPRLVVDFQHLPG